MKFGPIEKLSNIPNYTPPFGYKDGFRILVDIGRLKADQILRISLFEAEITHLFLPVLDMVENNIITPLNQWILLSYGGLPKEVRFLSETYDDFIMRFGRQLEDFEGNKIVSGYEIISNNPEILVALIVSIDWNKL